MAQSVEQLIRNQQVVGSSPISSSKMTIAQRDYKLVGQLSFLDTHSRCRFLGYSQVCPIVFLITVIWSCSTSIKHSLLHFGQKRGKFLRMVSSRILSCVLLPQIGQRIKSVFSMPITSHSGHYLFSFFLSIFPNDFISNGNTNTNKQNNS